MDRSNALERYGFELPNEATAIEAASGLVLDSSCGGMSLWVFEQISAFPRIRGVRLWSSHQFHFGFSILLDREDARSLQARNSILEHEKRLMRPFACFALLCRQNDFERVRCAQLDWLRQSSAFAQPRNSMVRDARSNAESPQRLLFLDATSHTAAFAMDGDGSI